MIRIALINAHGTKCLADHGIKPLLFSGLFSITAPNGGGGKKVFCHIFVSFHGALMIFIIDIQ